MRIRSFNGIIYDDDLEKATVFNHYFSSQSQVDESSSCLPNFFDSVPNNYLSNTEVSREEIEDILRSIDTGKAIGPDLINPRMLKEASSALSYPLRIIFNKSLISAVYPELWKKANVIPIHKKIAKMK